VGLVLTEDGQDIQIWLGGRRRFGHDPIIPEPLRYFELTDAWPMLDLVFHIHDQWLAHRLPKDETCPEMAQRARAFLGLPEELTPKTPAQNQKIDLPESDTLISIPKIPEPESQP
jgi:hypothetical protein